MSGTCDDMTEELYKYTILVVLLAGMVRLIIILFELKEKFRALAYTIRNLIEIYYGVYVLRYSLSICEMYRNNKIKQVDNLVFVVAVIYLIIYKIVLYI